MRGMGAEASEVSRCAGLQEGNVDEAWPLPVETSLVFPLTFRGTAQAPRVRKRHTQHVGMRLRLG
jgi:hypothetical protein